jgi:hypothetical protein
MFGFWAFPKGPIYSFKCISRNMQGGLLRNQGNAKLSLHLAQQNLKRGNIELAKICSLRCLSLTSEPLLKQRATEVLADITGGSDKHIAQLVWQSQLKATTKYLVWGSILVVAVLFAL